MTVLFKNTLRSTLCNRYIYGAVYEMDFSYNLPILLFYVRYLVYTNIYTLFFSDGNIIKIAEEGSTANKPIL